MHNLILLVLLFCTFLSCAQQPIAMAVTRGDTTQKNIALVFTGDEFGDGARAISSALKKHNVKASFFLTGNFYRNALFRQIINELKQDGHYLGSHSDKHLLYCDWEKRDSLLVSREQFISDLSDSYHELAKFGIGKRDASFFLPPFEWYNDSIVAWTEQWGLQLINFTPGTRSTTDYTYPEMGSRYVDSRVIYSSILDFERRSSSGLNGFILLLHIGTDPRRTDKFYYLLPELLQQLKSRGYHFLRIDDLL